MEYPKQEEKKKYSKEEFKKDVEEAAAKGVKKATKSKKVKAPKNKKKDQSTPTSRQKNYTRRYHRKEICRI